MISNEREYWTVGYSQWGRWQVRTSSIEYPYRYTLKEDLGPSIRAAYLEADGDFVFLPGQDHLSLLTEGVPWLFVITTSGKLYVKKALEPIENAVLLDTGVLEASVCRGWKSDKYSVDSGLFVAYTKHIGAYYQNYLEVNGEYVWSGAVELASTVVNHIEVKRLNDYRIAFYLDNPNRVLYSERFYIGGTSKTEYMYTSNKVDYLVFATTPVSEDVAFVINSVTLHNGNSEFWVEANYPFYSCDSSWVDDVSITTAVTTGQGIDSWWIEDGLLKIRMRIPLATAYAYMSFKIRALNRIRFIRTPQSRPLVPEVSIIYEAPPVPHQEHAYTSMSVNNVTFAMTERHDYTASYDKEHLYTSMAAGNATFSITPLGLLSADYSEEHLSTSMSAGNATFRMTQSGVTPI